MVYLKKMLENESEIMERIYKYNILDKSDSIFQERKHKLKKGIENLNISDFLTQKIKKHIILGFMLFIITAHIIFFMLRLLDF